MRRRPLARSGPVRGKTAEPQPVDVPRERRIFVNRNLRMDRVRAIGFDMDHTLADYRPEPFERLAFEQARLKVFALGYPRETLDLRYDQSFVIRGLIVDKRRGNILKMDRHHYVVQAYHGTRKLPPEMRRALYARRRPRVTGTTLVAIDTLYSIPEISLYAQMVDLIDAHGLSPDYRRLYEDVRGAIDEAHADGSIKTLIAQAPQRYLDLDPALPETLERMRGNGMKLFLLTNSEASYTGLIMERLLSARGPARRHWTDCFDLVLVRAGKPAFFARHAPLQPLDPRVLGAPGERRPRFTYAAGSVAALERALGVAGDGILFFGDHTYGDIMKSKRAVGWRTAMIIRRLEQEVAQLGEVRAARQALARLERRGDRLAGERDFLERALEGELSKRAGAGFLREHGWTSRGRAARQALERWRTQLDEIRREEADLEAAVEARFNPHWGSIFRAGRETSHFANQVERFACIYTSRVSNFLNYPMDKYFVTGHEWLPHER